MGMFLMPSLTGKTPDTPQCSLLKYRMISSLLFSLYCLLLVFDVRRVTALAVPQANSLSCGQQSFPSCQASWSLCVVGQEMSGSCSTCLNFTLQ